MDRFKFGKIVPSVLASCLASFTVIVFTPLSVLYANAMEFPIRAAEIIPQLAGIAVLAALCLTALVLLLPEPKRRKGTVLLSILGLLVWAQGNLMVWSYGQLNGSTIDFSQNVARGLLDSAVWVLLLA